MSRTKSWRDYGPKPYRSRSAITIAKLDAVSRTRALTEAESLELEWAIRREEANRARRPGLHQYHVDKSLLTCGDSETAGA